jgi:hypothetical protein
MVEQPKKKCFVIAPIGDDKSATREHSDLVLRYIINPVIEALGFAPGERADHLGKPGVITTQILERIAQDDLVIADLTDHNPNVFYELAIRHGLRKPFVQMIKADQRIPFDVGQQRTIKFDATTLPGGENAKEELKKQVQACLTDGFQMETPLGSAFDFQALQSGGAVERTLAAITEKLDGLARKVDVRFPDVQSHPDWDSLKLQVDPLMPRSRIFARNRAAQRAAVARFVRLDPEVATNLYRSLGHVLERESRPADAAQESAVGLDELVKSAVYKFCYENKIGPSQLSASDDELFVGVSAEVGDRLPSAAALKQAIARAIDDLQNERLNDQGVR